MHSWYLPILLFFKYGFKYIAIAVFGYGSVWLRRWRQRSKQTNALGWPSVEGVVVAAKSESIPKTHLYVVPLTYTYFVDEYRTGKFAHEFTKEEEADEFARVMRDRRLQIRYNQAKPDTSIIDQSTLQQLSPVFAGR